MSEDEKDGEDSAEVGEDTGSVEKHNVFVVYGQSLDDGFRGRSCVRCDAPIVWDGYAWQCYVCGLVN